MEGFTIIILYWKNMDTLSFITGWFRSSLGSIVIKALPIIGSSAYAK